MNPKIDYAFEQYVLSLSVCADYYLYKIRKQCQDDMEWSAYQTTNEYQEFKKLKSCEQVLLYHRLLFEGVVPRLCHELFWKMVKANGVCEMSVKQLEKEYDEFKLATAEFANNRRERLAEFGKMFKRIGG